MTEQRDRTEPWRICRQDRLLLAVVAVAVFFTNLGGPALWDRDEPRNAGCAREMLERGDWIVPTFNGELRSAKPVLPYWLMMSACRVFDDPEFAARFWSAVLGVGTVLLTARLGALLFGRMVGVWSGLFLTMSVMMATAARIATPDSYLIFFTTAAISVFARAVMPLRAGTGQQQPTHRMATGPTLLMYACIACGVLSKGPVGYAGPLAIMLVASWLLQRVFARNTDGTPTQLDFGQLLKRNADAAGKAVCFLRPVTGLLVVTLLAGPWYVAVTMATDGNWLSEFLLRHNLARALSPMENHSGPIWYYLVAISIGFFPGSVFLMPLVCDLSRRLQRTIAVGDLLCVSWVVVWVAGFSVASTKLPSYVTPAYPPLAILTARYLVQWQTGGLLIGKLLQRLPLVVLALSGVGIVAAAGIAAEFDITGLRSTVWSGIIVLVTALCGVVAAESGSVRRGLVCVTAGGVLFTVWGHSVAAWDISQQQRTGLLLQAIQRRSVDPSISSFGCLEPSWVYYAGRPIREISAAELSSVDPFLRASPNSFLITTRRRASHLISTLSLRIQVVASEPYFLKPQEELVVLRAVPDPSAAEIPADDSSGSVQSVSFASGGD